MDLQEFVSVTLTQIAAGVKDAQDSVRESGGYANPAHRRGSRDTPDSHFGSMPNGQNIFLIDFDVAVSVSGVKRLKLAPNFKSQL